MSSIIDRNAGLYDPSKRFAFTNITTEDFTSTWGGVPIVIKPGETIEISNTTPIPGAGHAIAVKMTNELVDKIIMEDAKLDEVSKNQPYYRSPKGMSLGVPAARKIWEDQIVRELAPEEESPALQTLRKQMREEIETGISAKQESAPVPVPTSLADFSELNTNQPVKETKKAAKTKTIK